MLKSGINNDENRSRHIYMDNIYILVFTGQYIYLTEPVLGAFFEP